jgi:cardiolipin synthase
VGSQNITEENFRKRLGSNAGPWIDANVRMRGPAVQALQATFLRDWVLDSEERLQNETRYFLQSATGEPTPRVGASIVQAIPSGPGPRPDAIHQGFLKMLYAAREEIIMTTPYFVPDEATKGALINAALRGIDVTIIVPEVSDSRLVAAASRAHFEDLMDAGIKIRLHQKGLLHSKAAVVDRTLAVIGSANFDQRSFWLNFEITLFVYDTDFASLLRFLQMQYHTDSREINPRSWRRRPLWKRFRDNSAQLLGPLL